MKPPPRFLEGLSMFIIIQKEFHHFWNGGWFHDLQSNQGFETTTKKLVGFSMGSASMCEDKDQNLIKLLLPCDPYGQDFG